jgi:acyl carrier protein
MNTDVVSVVRNYLETELRVRDAERLDAETPLLRMGVIDSLDIVKLAGFIEQTFRVRVNETELTPGNFRTLSAIARYVATKTNVH